MTTHSDSNRSAEPPVEHGHGGREGPRRFLNVGVAAISLVAGIPLMAAIAVLIKLTSPGPAVYSQKRVGVDRRRRRKHDADGKRRIDLGGQVFTMYKFRTMHANGPEPEVWARPDDPRVTRLGRLLRRFRLDEMPQLVNVLRGDMNLVGPRPEQPKIFAELREAIDRYAERQRLRPGITGLAQVTRPYDCSIEDVRHKLALDLEYARRQSVLEDLKILIKTPFVMLFKGGAH